MTTMLKEMKKAKYGISQKKLDNFERIIQKYEGSECDEIFMKAMNEQLSKEQRFHIYETQGGCNGTGLDKQRKAFAHENANIPLAKRLELFAKTFGRWKPVLNDDNTMTLNFKCSHGYYKRAKEGKYTTPPPNVETYFERCAGGRLYELQKALGIKLKIKSVDVSPLNENIENQVIFIFEIVD
ncbi:MAG: hypothetical protein LBD23_08710 [Oscillospiraceae bacterium]|jgi:hypothetical protein|nr:hypothetical protein [Oscillospiraceae bacterium]